MISFEATGTIWNIDLFDSNKDLPELKKSIQNFINSFENTYSRFIPTSFLFNLKNQIGIIKAPVVFVEILKMYFDFYYLTNGSFTPLIATLLEQTGYDQNYSFLEAEQIEDVPDLQKTIRILDDETIEILEPVSFDFGGIGKGYLIDKVKEILDNNNVKSYSINAGGDIYYRGDLPIKVALENPNNFNEAIGIVEISNKSICGSSGNRRKWGKFHHIFNPKTKASSDKILASWVVADSTIIADTIATCLFLTEPEKLLEKYRFDYLILNSDFSIKRSENFNAQLFIK